MGKLQDLADIEGMDLMDMLEEATYDSVVPAICRTKGCDYSTGMEPDQWGGWCPVCRKESVVSCLVLAGII